MTEANAENRQFSFQFFHQRNDGSGVLRVARSVGKEQPVRREFFDFFRRNVVREHRNVRPAGVQRTDDVELDAAIDGSHAEFRVLYGSAPDFFR